MEKQDNDLLSLYARQGFWSRFHIKTRYMRSRPWELEAYFPIEGRFLDIGCGHGVFANLLSLSSPQRMVSGIDISSNKISVARDTIGNRKNINFLVSDIHSFKPSDDFDGISLIDVLYLVPFDLQEEILRVFHKHLKQGGILLISEVCKDKSLRFYRVLLQEFISVRLLKITSGNKFYFRRNREWEALLSKIGFNVKRIIRHTANPTNLYICRKV